MVSVFHSHVIEVIQMEIKKVSIPLGRSRIRVSPLYPIVQRKNLELMTTKTRIDQAAAKIKMRRAIEKIKLRERVEEGGGLQKLISKMTGCMF